MWNINLDTCTTCWTNKFHCYFYLFLYLMYFSVSSDIFHAWLHKVIQDSNLYWWPTKEATDKTSLAVARTLLCNYVSKGNSNKAFPKSRYCSVIILSSFIKQVELCEGGYHRWFTCICWFKWVAKPSIEESVIAIFFKCLLPLWLQQGLK